MDRFISTDSDIVIKKSFQNQIEDKASVRDLLKKIFNGKGQKIPDLEFDPRELKIGTFIELEHTGMPEIAKRIAKDHLAERKDYYKFSLFADERREAIRNL